MTDYILVPRETLQSAVKALETIMSLVSDLTGRPFSLKLPKVSAQRLRALLDQPCEPVKPVLTGCACRWDADDNRVATCVRHQGWLDVVHEYAERAKAAEKPQPCCGKYEICDRACTPRGRYEGEKLLASRVDTPPVEAKREVQLIAEVLRIKHGLTLVKTANGYDVIKLGDAVAHNIGAKK